MEIIGITYQETVSLPLSLLSDYLLIFYRCKMADSDVFPRLAVPILSPSLMAAGPETPTSCQHHSAFYILSGDSCTRFILPDICALHRDRSGTYLSTGRVGVVLRERDVKME